ncbi:hypothetical protein D3C72_922650 [compost metagenome]
MLFIVFVYLVYSIIYGNPFAKHDFKSEVEIYLKNNYKDEMNIESIEYSFKESTSLVDQHFIAVVHSKDDKKKIMRISKGYKDDFEVYEVPRSK